MSTGSFFLLVLQAHWLNCTRHPSCLIAGLVVTAKVNFWLYKSFPEFTPMVSHDNCSHCCWKLLVTDRPFSFRVHPLQKATVTHTGIKHRTMSKPKAKCKKGTRFVFFTISYDKVDIVLVRKACLFLASKVWKSSRELISREDTNYPPYSI